MVKEKAFLVVLIKRRPNEKRGFLLVFRPSFFTPLEIRSAKGGTAVA